MPSRKGNSVSAPGLVEQQVANLIGSVSALDAQVRGLIGEFVRERDRAELHRQTVSDGLGVLNNSVRALSNEIEAMKPTIADYREKRAEGRGEGRLWRRIWTVVAVLITAGASIAGALLAASWRGAAH